MSVTRIDSSIEHVNVRLLGCAADGATNDTTRFQAAVNLGAALKRSDGTYGRTVYVPDGVYVLDSVDLPTGTNLIMSDGAVLKCRLGNTPVLRVGSVAGSAGNVLVRGGKVLGTWDYATYQGNTVSADGGRKSGENLIKITNDNGGDVSNVRIEGVEIKRSAGYGIYAGSSGTGRTVSRIVIERCRFIQNRSGMNVQNNTGNSMRGLTIRNCYCDETWDPGSGVHDGKGGNFIGIIDRVDQILVEGNVVDACGRITLEITPPGYNSTTNRCLPVGAKIVNNVFARGRYRTWSVFAIDQYAAGNTIFERDYLEVGGRNTMFTGNTVFGPGVYLQQYIGNTVKQGDFSTGIRVTHNWFQYDTDFGYGKGALQTSDTTDVLFANNEIVYSATTNLIDPVNDTRFAVIRVDGSQNVRITGNRIRWTGAAIDRSIIGMVGCTRSVVSDNQIDIEATAIDASVAATWNPIFFNKLDRCRIERNSVRAAHDIASAFAPVLINAGDPTRIVRRKFSAATTYADTIASSAVVLNTPPGSPVTNGYYLVGDNPTGAWAAQPRTFAKWDGAIWSFEAVTDLFNDLTTVSAYLEADGGAPVRATTGDTYAIVRNATLVKCTVRDNRFEETANNLKGTFGDAIVFESVTNGGQVAWRNTFSGNDLIADYTTRGKTGIAT